MDLFDVFATCVDGMCDGGSWVERERKNQESATRLLIR
jgi:hypothetical protein